MTDVRPREPSDAESPDALARDDEMLDALGRGDRPAGDDQVAVMLADWREDLDEPAHRVLRDAAPGPETVTLFPVTPEPPADGRAYRPRRDALPSRHAPSAPGRDKGPRPTRPGSPFRAASSDDSDVRRSRRYRIALVAAAVFAVGALAGGVVAAASSATPNSPLWPVSQLLNPQRADRVAAQDALDRALTAAREGRFSDALRLIDQAQTLISKVDDPAERNRLQMELDRVRQLVSTAGGVSQPGSPPRPGPSGGPGPAGSSNPPSGILPSVVVPSSVLPSLPVPSLPLPSVLPSLPIIGG